MKNFHRLGAVALVAFVATGALIAWVLLSGELAAHHGLARLALKALFMAAGVFWAWYAHEERQRTHPLRFTDRVPFVEHLELSATFDGFADAIASRLAAGQAPTAIVAVDGVGFEARVRGIDAAQADVGAVRLGVQLLKPATALAALHPGAAVRVLIDGGPSGTGEVLRTSPSK